MSKGFDKEDGFFVKSLDDALASFNVERQAYHGGSFIGNHIHRALKVSIDFHGFANTILFLSSVTASKHRDSLYLYSH